MIKILVIDNEGKLTSKVEKILPATYYKIYISNDKNDAYRIAIRYHPELILFCCSDRKEELTFIKRICSDDILSIIPLIILTMEFLPEVHRTVMDMGADDYLSEKFLESSLQCSIEKRFAKLSLINRKVHSSINTFDEFIENNKNDHILVKIGNRLKLIEFGEIVCVTALKEYSKIITSENCKIIVRKSLKQWIKILPSKIFLRIHRATIININYIEEIIKTNERTYTVHLKKTKETFDFSYRFANIMRKTFPT